MTFWRYHPQLSTAEILPDRVAFALSKLHGSLRQLSPALKARLPSYMAELRSVRRLLADRAALPALEAADRDLLMTTFDRLQARLDGLASLERFVVLHGSPHAYNVLAVGDEPVFIDFETTCMSPLEWDVADLDSQAEPFFRDSTQAELLWLCRGMAGVKTATWCMAEIDRGDMREHAEPNGLFVETAFVATPVEKVVAEVLGCVGFSYLERGNRIEIVAAERKLRPEECPHIKVATSAAAVDSRSSPAQERTYSWRFESISADDFLQLLASVAQTNILRTHTAQADAYLAGKMLRVDVSNITPVEALGNMLACIGWTYEKTDVGYLVYEAAGRPLKGECMGLLYCRSVGSRTPPHSSLRPCSPSCAGQVSGRGRCKPFGPYPHPYCLPLDVSIEEAMNRRLLLAAVLPLMGGIGSAASGQGQNFRESAAEINSTIRANHYHPAELDSEAYRQIERQVIALGEKAQSADEFMNAFNAIWRRGPFSHVGLQKAQGSAADRIARLDTLIVGPEAVTLAWRDSTAILTVNTMIGADTIKAIETAYGEIVARKAEKLIIDLRRNDGGAFAVVPLIGHLIEKPIDAGVFVVGSWYADHQKPPGPADFPSATPWRGYSIKAFQAEVRTRPLTSYRIDPMQPRFQGPVFVLTSDQSISAAEIAADALKSIGRAKIIGEKTPGVVLSSNLFDIPGGFHLRVPIADYFSIKSGHLDGVGVTPDIPVSADQAFDVALGQ